MEQCVKCDIDILNLLKHANHIHIDYLVDVLTDNGKGRLALSSSIKDLLINEKAEKKYSEKGLRYLLNELQEYGGHSFVNVFRKEPLPYSELLTDVHKKLNGLDSQKKSAPEKEREIVLSLFGSEWHALEDHERWERCTEPKVLSGFFDIQKNLNFDVNGVPFGFSAAASLAAFTAIRLNPATAILSTIAIANQSISEAYRITIPFIAHIAMMKMIYSSEIKK